tara:strand:- start:3662 stop:4222 length:561 start_codon:yes stop_codon:yes gene_type:complete
MSNLKLWSAVEKTNPNHTKKANVRGNNITAIAPQRQIKNATEQFGVYGQSWGFKEIAFDYTMLELTGIIVFNGLFYFPEGEFPISSSISAYRDNARLKPDADFAKKVETDALTKALSKLGFNADVFMGLYDDHKYVQMMNEEFNKPEPSADDMSWINAIKENAENEKQIIDPVYLTRIQLFIKEGY